MTEGKVWIVGSGGVGFWLAAALARSGTRNMVVLDDDNLSGGLGHMRLPAASPSTKKVDLLRGYLSVNMGLGLQDLPEFRDVRFTGKEVEAGDLVVDCSDMDIVVRRRIWANAERREARIVRVSYDGRNNTVVVSQGLPLGAATGNYAEMPSLALSFMAGGIGAIAVRKLVEGYEGFVEFQISLDEYFPESTPIAEAAAA